MVYIIVCEQKVSITSRAKKIASSSLPQIDELNFITLDLDDEEVDLNSIILEASSLPLGYNHKVVLVYNCAFLLNEDKKTKENPGYQSLIKYLNNPNQDCDLILAASLGEEDKLDQKSSVVNIVKEIGKVVEQKVDPKDIKYDEYIINYFAKQNVQIDKDALLELKTRVGTNISLLQNSADVLALYTDHVTLEDVYTFVNKPLEENTFLIYNNLIRGKKDLALAIYRDLLAQNEETITVVTTLANQFRTLNEVLYLSNKGYNFADIAKELNMKEARASIICKQLYLTSASKIEETLEALHQLDYQIKSGLLDRSYAFEMFILKY